jgi:hypothetical protein
MDTKSPRATGAALLNSPRTQLAFTAAKRSITVYGALTARGLVAASSGHLVNTLMLVRAVLLPAVAVLLYRMTVEKIPSEKGPPRKVYSLNAQGQEYLEEFWRTWSILTERLEQLHKGGK